MCGLVGWAGPGASAEAIGRGVAALDHRGPDASGVQTIEGGAGSTCVLGSVRLRIIDLSPEGDQPMSTPDGSVSVAFNGELYNHLELRAWLSGRGHAFRSGTDTEDLLYAYLESAERLERFPGRLRGMFAFAIWDASRSRLVLVRDRLGIKPLYLADAPGGGIAFSSEVRALVRAGVVPAEPDPASVRGYLLRGVVPAPGTILEGVRELAPGSMAIWEPGRPLQVRRWWEPSIEPDPAVASDPVAALRTSLEDSVARHLVADRPAGIFLSSGVDSGAIATVAARQGSVRTFTVTFPDMGDDEGDQASELASLLGAEHQRVPVTGGDVAGWVHEVLADMDQPTHDGMNSWLVCRAAHEAGLVVALSGLGGDELFGGYATFEQVPKVARLRSLSGLVPRPIRDAIGRRIASRTPGDKITRILGAPRGVEGAYGAVRGLFSPIELGLGPDAGTRRGMGGASEEMDVRDAVTLLEATRYMHDQLLRDTDQMSMAHSLEVRVPLLDDDVVATALATPAAQRTRPGKQLLVEASGLPIVHAKRPFALPVDRWIAGPLKETVREGLLSESLPFSDLVPVALRRNLWDAVASGRGHWSRPWAVTALRLWPGAQGYDWR